MARFEFKIAKTIPTTNPNKIKTANFYDFPSPHSEICYLVRNVRRKYFF